MRFKPPPPTLPNIGWRVEFRSMEIQTTDFENAAFAVFVVLLTRTILSFDLNFYMKLSNVDENMQTAQKRNAVLNEKFIFRKNIFGDLNNPSSPTPKTTMSLPNPCDPDIDVRRGQLRPSMEALNTTQDPSNNEFALFSIDTIINGKENEFVGLIPLIKQYLSSMPLDNEIAGKLDVYLDLVAGKANGSIPTTAKWIRDFVANHDGYKSDSVVSEEVNFDLMQAVAKLN